uniref:Uncharacterized protein n=1 Tax=Tanacetum cinerariifolium TaxID=118510 RepID=A0A6L2JNN8_TANCI|nr:hypothetical protein [Tanacetum cinerariifolium]
MDTCATLTQKVANLEQDKIAQALEITKLKQRVRRLEKKRRTKHSDLKRRIHPNTRKNAKLDVDEDVTLEDVDDEVAMDANILGRMVESQAKVYNLYLQHSKIVLSMVDTDEAKPTKVEEVLEVVTAAKLMTEVVTTAAPITTATQVPKPSAQRKRRGVVIQNPKETAAASVIVQTKLEAELNANINWTEVIEQVKRREKQDNEVMRYQPLKRKPLTEAQARKNMMIYLKNMARLKMNFFKGMAYSEIRPIFEKHYNSIQAFLEKGEKEIEEEGSKIKANDDDDVYSKATPLALKKLVKERFKSTEPNNFSDDFLLNTLKNMFEKPNVEASIWRDQKGRYGLAKTSRKYAKGLMLLVEELVLLVHIDAVRRK